MAVSRTSEFEQPRRFQESDAVRLERKKRPTAEPESVTSQETATEAFERLKLLVLGGPARLLASSA